MIADKACFERGCPCLDRGEEGIEVVEKKEWRELTDEEVVERANADYDPTNFARGVAWAAMKLKGKNT